MAFLFPFHLPRTSCEDPFPAPAKEQFDWKPGTSHDQENTIFFLFLFHIKDFSNHTVSLSLLAALAWSGLEAPRYSTSIERWMSSAGRRMGGCECKELIGQSHCLGELVSKGLYWKPDVKHCIHPSHLVFNVCYSLFQINLNLLVSRLIEEMHNYWKNYIIHIIEEWTKIRHAHSTLPVQIKHSDFTTSDADCLHSRLCLGMMVD